MAGRFWTESEDGYLVASYGKKTAAAIGERIGRTRRAVYQRALKLGIVETRDDAAIAARDKKIWHLHSQGWNASEMVPVVGIDGRTINSRIHKLGLEPHGRGERYRKRVAETTRRQCAKLGVKSLAEVRSLRIREVARDLGWPEHLCLRSVQILEALYQIGPMTRKQIAVAIGVKWLGSRKTFSSNRAEGHSYLAELQRAGLVVRIESAITHKGKGNHQDLYMVGLEVEPCQKNRKR